MAAAVLITTTKTKMRNNIFSRSESMLGSAAMEKLAGSHVAVFGIGGVGGHLCEALARCGVGTLTIVDADIVSESNINRQLVALCSTLGQRKCDVMASRLKDINPDINIISKPVFFNKESAQDFNFSDFDYVADAIDTVTSKLLLCEICHRENIPIISSMGTGNKLNPSLFEICDISKTSVCPLARVMRYELRKRDIKHLKVLFSKEVPQKAASEEKKGIHSVPCSVSFVPPAAGLMIAGEIIKDLIK